MAARRRLAAIMFTDVVGFTAATRADEPGALARLREQEGIVRPLFPPYGGKEIKSTGDGFLAEFDSVLKAAECGLEIQRRIGERNAKSSGSPVELRIGIHVGDVEELGGDIHGDAVNVAARIVTAAEPGGICLTEQVVDQIRDRIPLPLERMPSQSLKGLPSPVRLYRLGRPAGRADLPSRMSDGPRIAVLPFANISPDPKDEYFADGMTEELISSVSRLPGVGVISRTSVMQFKNTTRPVVEIGRELHVGTVVEGSVRKAGDRVRITVQLIDAETDRHLWVESYDRTVDDVFVVQGEIAQRVADSLKIRLQSTDAQHLARAPTRNMEAYSAYLKGLAQAGKSTDEGNKQALSSLFEAAALDPHFAVAYAEAAHVFLHSGFFEMIPLEEALSEATRLARTALELDPTLADAHLVMAEVLRSRWDLTGFEQELRVALDLGPNLAQAHSVRASYFIHLGRKDEAAQESAIALALDPLSPQVQQSAATWYLYADRVDKAIPIFEEAIARDPESAFAWGNLGLSHLRQGKLDLALPEMQQSVAKHGTTHPLELSDLAYLYARLGKREEVLRIADQILQFRGEGHAGAFALASVYAHAGDRAKMFEWLEIAHRERVQAYYFLRLEFAFEKFWDDAEFRAFIERLGDPAPEAGPGP